MHPTRQKYTQEVLKEDIFLSVSEFQKHKQIQWGNPNTIQHNENLM